MKIDETQNKDVAKLRDTFAKITEDYLHSKIDALTVIATSAQLTSYEEIDSLSDELLQQCFWAMQHILHRPACWAPKREEIEYLLLCLRDEAMFDPEQVEFTYLAPSE